MASDGAARARRAQNERLVRIAGRIARVGGWEVDLADQRVTWSREIHEILESESPDPPPLEVAVAMYPPEWRPVIEGALEETARTGRPFDLQMEIVTLKGNRLWVRAVGEAVRAPDGTVARIVGAFQDLSAVRRTEEELRESRARFELAVAGSESAIWDWDLRTNEVFISPHFSSLLGYAPGELVHSVESFFEGAHPDDRDAVWEAVQAHLADGKPFRAEYRLRTKSGTYRWFAASGKSLLDTDGKPYRMAGSLVDVHERRDAEEKSRELATRLLETLESITDGVLIIDRDWRITFLNEKAEGIVLQKREALVGQNLWAAFPAARGSAFERSYEHAMSTNETVEFEAFYPEPLNAWFSVRAFPSTHGLALYFRDVTAQRTVQRELAESEERFQILSRATNDTIWDWDLATDLVWWNEGYERLFGYPDSVRDPSSASWTEFLHPDDKDRVLKHIHEVIDSTEVSWSDEYRFRCVDGSYRRVLNRGQVIRDDAGRAVRMVGGMTDLTDRLAADQRLTKQARLIDEASDAIIELDLEQQVVFWSRGAEHRYGWSAADAMGRPLGELIVDRPERLTPAIEAVIAGGEWSGELAHRRRTGEVVTSFGRWTLLRDESGEPQSILAIETDITERRKIEQQFLRSQRMESIGTLAGGIAHDLNNVLAPILMSIELLRMDELDPVRIETLGTIEMSAKRGAEMVRQVLSFARGVEGRRVELQLRHVIADVVKITGETFPKNITIESAVAKDLWTIVADATQLHQVLVNLCVNARDALSSGGRLRITAENRVLDAQYAGGTPGAQRGPHVVLQVEDSGAGMTSDVLENIFDPFFTTKEPGQGTGLGLPTCEAIVKSHGGFIRAYSEPLKGSRFRVYLPARPEAQDADVELVEKELPRGSGETILVVDDEPSVRQITRDTLEAFGYRVRVAADGAEAVARYAREMGEIDVVLTDMMMPVMDGASTINVLRKLNPHVRIIAASGLGTDGKVAQIRAAGVRHFLSKPFTADLLLHTVREVLSDPRTGGGPR